MKYFLLVLLPCCLYTAKGYAEPQPQHFRLKPEITNWAWVKEPWTGSSTPYLFIKRRIDTAFKKTQQIETVTQKYKEDAFAHPNNAQAQYGWAYSACAGRPIGIRTRGSELADIAVALDKAPQPKAVEYDRVRFIVTMRWAPYLQLKPLGKRLLQRDIKDYRVKYSMINLLVVGTSDEKRQALTYAQQLVESYPKRSGSYSSLGWVYAIMFTDKKDLTLGGKAISCYRKSIALSNDPLIRQSIQQTIDTILSEQKRLRITGKAYK